MATGEEIRQFWAQTRAALSKVDMDAKVELVESSDPFVMEGGIKTRTASCVIMSSFEGRRIRAWYTVPSGHPPTRGWPAILEVPGYGGILPLPIHLVQYGYATLTLYPRGQGESLQEWQIEHGTRVVYGRSFQSGEGWHSNENAVHFWNSSLRIPKETHSQCYASATAYVMMIPLCNHCSARLKRPTPSRSSS